MTSGDTKSSKLVLSGLASFSAGQTCSVLHSGKWRRSTIIAVHADSDEYDIRYLGWNKRSAILTRGFVHSCGLRLLVYVVIV